MLIWRLGAVLLGLSLSGFATAQTATPRAGENVRISVRAHKGRAAFSLQAFLYRPNGSGKHPLVL